MHFGIGYDVHLINPTGGGLKLCIDSFPVSILPLEAIFEMYKRENG